MQPLANKSSYLRNGAR